MQSEAEQRERLRASRLALLVGTAVFLGKLLVFASTGSAAVFSDAMESVVNVAAAAMLLYSTVLAARPADPDHPYGHGKVEFFSAGFEGALVLVAGMAILVEAIGDLTSGPELHRIGTGLISLTLLSALNGALGFYLIRVGRRTHSAALVADGEHVLTDVQTSVGVLVGLAAVGITDWVILDPLIAMVIGANILRTGWRIAREAVSGLMDEAHADTLVKLSSGFDRHREPSWIDVHSLRAWRSGNFTHVDLHLVVPRYFDVDGVHDLNDRVEARVRALLDGTAEVIVHYDPCRPRQCETCRMEDCPVRGDAYRELLPWSVERTTRIDEALETGDPVNWGSPS